MDDLFKTLRISAAGMKVQGTRLRVVSENIANADSLAQTPDGDPYRRKTITFKNELDRAIGLETVRVHRIGTDSSTFDKSYDPNHLAANADGYVQVPKARSPNPRRSRAG